MTRDVIDCVLMNYILSIVRQHDEIAPYINAVIQIDLAGVGSYYLDFTKGKDSDVARGQHPNPDCVISMPGDEFTRLLTKASMIWVESYLDGKIVVQGNMIAFAGLSVLFDHIKPSWLGKLFVSLLGIDTSIKLIKKFSSQRSR